MASLMRGIDAEKYDRAYSDRDLVLRTCREDGVLVQPDVPVTALPVSVRLP